MGFKENFKTNGGWCEVGRQLLIILMGCVVFGGAASLYYGTKYSNHIFTIIGAVIVSVSALALIGIVIYFTMFFTRERRLNKNYVGERVCPVCNKPEFPREQNSYTICRFCGWEDETVDDPDVCGGGSNNKSLNDYKKEYAEFIAADPNYVWEKSFRRGKFVKPKEKVFAKE